MKRIDTLTTAQKAQLAPWAEKWTRIGLCTDPADRPRFEAAVVQCYAAAGLAPPKHIVWVQSPLVLSFAVPIAAELLAHRGDVMGGAVRGAVGGGAVHEAVRGAVDDAVGRAGDRAVHEAVRGAVGGAVYDAVRGAVDEVVAVGGAVDDAVRGAVDDAVRGAVGGAVRGAGGRLWSFYIGGQFWVGGWWGSPAFVAYFLDVCGLDLGADMNARARAYADTCQSACWWWPHREFVMVSDRPRTIARDDRGRLHSLSGPACGFRDGWGAYAVHGVQVPSEWIERRADLDPTIALTWPNVEQRRAAAEIVGWARVLEHVRARIVDEDPDPEVGTLLDVDLPDAPKSRFLRVRCATGRTFVLSVPTEMKTALEANAWTYGLETTDLRQLEVRL